MKNILGALKARMLPASIESIDGISCCLSPFLQNNGRCKPGCSTCREICLYFPLRSLIEETGEMNFQGSCLDDAERYRILLQRPGGKVATRELMVSGTKLYHFVRCELDYYWLVTNNDEGRALKEKLEKLGAFSEEGDERTVPIQYMTKRTLNTLDGLISLGFDPKFVTKGDLCQILYEMTEIEGREYRLIAKSTFDSLVSRGFDLDRKDVNVFDEKEVPGLQKLLEND